MSLATSENARLQVHDLVLDLDRREVKRCGRRIVLSNKEFHLLVFFMKNHSRVLTRMEIYENVWDRNATILTNTIDVHVMNLRRKLDFPFAKRLIKTIYCVGYYFG